MEFCSRHVIDGQILFERAAISIEDFHTQYQAISQQQQVFAALSVSDRAKQLLALATRLEAEQARLAKQICIEVGRCLRECEAEISKSIALIRYYAHLSPELLAHKTIATQASLSQVRFEPLGVILSVMPWNYPVWQVLRFAIPALCAGNACLVKPAPTVGGITQMLFDLVDAALPLQVAWLAPENTEQAIAQTQALAFTGSTHTGRHLAALAGKYLRKSVMELGGSNALIVLDDADVAQAAQDACYSRFRDAGQSCNAAKRLIVTEAVADQFLEVFLAECAKLTMGAPWLPETTLAPLHRADLRAQLHEQVQDALAQGARCLSGGYLPSGPGNFYPATVLDNVNPRCRVYHEEVFGPVAVVLRARDAEEAVILANDTPFGLGASIYTQNTEYGWQLAPKLAVGSVFINRHTSSDLRLPFGGIKDSGFGRELSEFGLYEFVNVKAYWQK
ncbi:aldehyde dehydrogenase family protein [Snodgrassella sp. CFCC 13594]|uniref:aldehyde dehydrogenase family protein n=1 Tax=Snodgrassella sp. CFCC 13594 TaxID=1775559 RepID=UPI00082AD3B7|nr:aldehyde dehydrogenase family protein [Snodgrassella sp. CFCC 13594]